MGRGGLIFVAGEPGSGRSHLLRELRLAVEKSGVDANVIAGGYRDGIYVPSDVARRLGAPEVQAVLRDAFSIGAGLITSVGPLLEQLLNLMIDSVDAARRLHEDLSGAEIAELLPRALRAASHDRALVLLIDDADQAEASWWITLLLNFAREVNEELPILGVFTYQALPRESARARHIGSDVDAVARSLESRHLGTQWQLTPLTKPEIERWIGAPLERELLDALWELSQGLPGPVTDAWADWTERALITEGPNGSWRSAGPATAILDAAADDLAQRVARLLPDASVELMDDVRRALGGAALQGRKFTADAVAAATSWDRDTLIDLIDEHLIESPSAEPGILDDLGGVQVSSPGRTDRTLWRYAFRSSSHWQVARARFLGATELVETAERLSEALVEAYGSDVPRIAREVAALRRITGDHAGAAYADFLARSQPSQAILRSAAQHYLGMSTEGWSSSDFMIPCEWLLKAARELQYSDPYEWLVQVAKQAELFAQHAKHPVAEAWAVFLEGRSQVRLGKHRSGRSQLQQAMEHSARDPTLESEIAFVLAGSMEQTGELEESDEWAERAAQLYQRTEDWRGLAQCWTLRGEIAASRDDLGDAERFGRRAIKLARNTGRHSAEADAAHLLGKLALRRRELDEARTWGLHALSRSQEYGSRLGEAAAWNLLARIESAEGNLDAAADHGLKALAIQEAMHDYNGTSSSLLLLATIEFKRGQDAEARTRAEAALRLFQSAADVERVINALGLLARVAHRLGDRELEAQHLAAIDHGLAEHTDAGIAAGCRRYLTELGLPGYA